MRGQRIRLILLQVVDYDNRVVGLVPVLSKFSPSDLGTTITEDRGVGGTMFPRGNLLAVFALEIDDVDLRTQLVTSMGPGLLGLTFCLVCHAGGSSGSNAVYTTWVLDTSKSSFPPNGSTGDL